MVSPAFLPTPGPFAGRTGRSTGTSQRPGVRCSRRPGCPASTAWDDPGTRRSWRCGVCWWARTEVGVLRSSTPDRGRSPSPSGVSSCPGATIELGLLGARAGRRQRAVRPGREATLVMFDLQAGPPRRLSPPSLDRFCGIGRARPSGALASHDATAACRPCAWPTCRRPGPTWPLISLARSPGRPGRRAPLVAAAAGSWLCPSRSHTGAPGRR